MRQRGFSLIEVAAVTAIVGTLVAILLPTLSKASKQSRDVTCKATLSQMGRAAYVYAAKNAGMFPKDQRNLCLGLTEAFVPWAESYLDNGNGIVCAWETKKTGLKMQHVNNKGKKNPNSARMSYQYENEILRESLGIETRVKRRPYFPLFYDFLDVPTRNHDEGSNVLFSDSHVEFWKPYDPNKKSRREGYFEIPERPINFGSVMQDWEL